MIPGKKSSVTINYVLFKLNEVFKVVDISSDLMKAEDKDSAANISSKYNYDRVPIESNGTVSEYFDSTDNKLHQITSESELSPDSGIIETFDYLSRRDYYYILQGNSLTSIVHYSDLNNPLMLLGVFAQISFCETEIRNFLRSRVKEETQTKQPDAFQNEEFLSDVDKRLSGIRINLTRSKSQFNDKVKTNSQTDIFDELYFDDELIISRAYGLTSLGLLDSDISNYNKLRNSITHSKPDIIKTKSDTGKWLTFLQECKTIIGKVSEELSQP